MPRNNDDAAQRERERQQAQRERERQQAQQAQQARERQAAETAKAKAAAQQRIDAQNAAAAQQNAAAQTKNQQIKEAENAKAALRIAGSDGNITNKEAQKIKNQFDVTDSRIIKATDQLNAGLKERGKDLKIGVGSNYVNQVIKNQESGWALDRMMGKSTYGDGAIGQAVTKYRDSAYTLKPGEGMVMGNWDERAKSQSAAGLMPLQRGGAYQINSAGGYSPKVSNQAFGNPVLKINPNPTPTTALPETTTTSNPLPPEEILPMEQLPEEQPMDPGPGMMSGGGAGAAGANKLGRAKSRLRKLGIYGRGTGLLGRGLQYGNVLNV